MRVLQKESKDLKQLIREAGFEEGDFEWIKRRGKLHLVHSKSKSSKAYFRRNETRLNDQLQWEKVVLYFLWENGKLQPMEDWDQLLDAYRNWLKHIP
ncbi:hypothetical protein KFE98_03175 [bacterium SCSIO 12741]|nr:hypothetical protein KFE98_03175 [bacterium SCSIO 12741]